MKVVVRLSLLLVVAVVVLQSQNPNVSDREKDCYAIYSLMMTNPETQSRTDGNDRYLIAAITGPGVPARPCVQAPAGREADLQEVLADFESRKAVPRHLKSSFSSNKPYLLLSGEDVDAFMKAKRNRSNQEPGRAEFKGVTDLFTLTDVYFNQRGTVAFSGLSSWCGDSCALWRWRVFEKAGGKWEEQKLFYFNEPGRWLGCLKF